MTISINYEWYDTKYALAESILPILSRYKTNYVGDGYCIPNWIEESLKKEYLDKEIESLKERWIEIIDNMILGFQSLLAYKEPRIYSIEHNENLVQEAVNNLAKYYLHLWD